MNKQTKDFKISQMVLLCKCNMFVAISYLQKTNYDVNAAIENYKSDEVLFEVAGILAR